MNAESTCSPDSPPSPAAHLPMLASAEVDHHLPVLPSADLLRGQKAVSIQHNGSLYRLQITRQGKLILTK